MSKTLQILTVAKWWINGKEQPHLTDGDYNGQANSIFVYKGDVYICGYEVDANNVKIGKLWINGVPQTDLIDGSSDVIPESIYVYNGDVYMAGTIGTSAVYWKNQESPVILSGGTKAHSIFVYDGDVYCYGIHVNQTAYWKNGVKQSDYVGGAAFDTRGGIFVKNNIIYLVCSNNSGTNIAKYWKSGEETKDLADPSVQTYASSIFVSLGGVYIGGFQIYGARVAKYWKNGKGVELSTSTSDSEVYSIFVAPY